MTCDFASQDSQPWERCEMWSDSKRLGLLYNVCTLASPRVNESMGGVDIALAEPRLPALLPTTIVRGRGQYCSGHDPFKTQQQSRRRATLR